MRLENKIAIVTASTKGIGKAIATSFVAEGATVYLAVRNKELGNALAEELNQMGPGAAKVAYCDACQLDSYKPMVEEVLADAGRIDILVNNFGGTNPTKDLDIVHGKWSDFSKDIETNLGSVFITSHYVLNKAMVKQKSGSIINIGSIAGITNDYKQCAYGTAKAGIIHLSQQIAVQVGQYGVRCNVVCPGMTATAAVTDNLPPAYIEKFGKATPLMRMATPEEIAAAVTYFASDESAFTTGQVLSVEGGYASVPATYSDDVGSAAMKRKKNKK
ncbi:MAG: SDR family NAD(P)-dependent oxidoreductase [Hespellia sp.]|nr:SDR family NAD(P)-dependent oxidoreductase [Hespellia sp.]